MSKRVSAPRPMPQEPMKQTATATQVATSTPSASTQKEPKSKTLTKEKIQTLYRSPKTGLMGVSKFSKKLKNSQTLLGGWRGQVGGHAGSKLALIGSIFSTRWTRQAG